MDSIEEIAKKVEEGKAVATVEPEKESAQIAPAEVRQYSAMSAPMTKIIQNSTPAPDPTVSDEVTDKIQQSVDDALKDEKFVKKKSRSLAKTGSRSVDVEIEYRNNRVEARKAQNKVDKQTIKNSLYVAKQEKRRAVKEQRHLNQCQRETHRQEIASYRWKEYGDMLQGYGFKKTPSNLVFKVVVFLDGAARFWDGLNKANNKLVKALKWFIIVGAGVGIYFLIKKYL